MTDDRGALLGVGDEVCVTYIDRSRGAEMWMSHGTITGFGRTRVKVSFPAHTGIYSVGPECLRLLRAW